MSNGHLRPGRSSSARPRCAASLPVLLHGVEVGYLPRHSEQAPGRGNVPALIQDEASWKSHPGPATGGLSARPTGLPPFFLLSRPRERRWVWWVRRERCPGVAVVEVQPLWLASRAQAVRR